MARQNYNVNTSEKKLEVYSSFGGGMVTQSHPEKLKDDQAVLMENADIVAGGVIENRGAYATDKSNGGTITGQTQGKFRYEDIATGGKDIVAINGKLYTISSGGAYTYLPITNLAQFQQSRPIESVQYRDKLYIATGSGLVLYDGTTATLVPAYVPNGLEYLYVGSNGYHAAPDSAIQDTTGSGDVILSVVPNMRYGLLNTAVTFTAYIQKVLADTVEYQWELKSTTDTAYVVVQAWGASKTFVKTFTTDGDYMLRISLRKVSTTLVLSEYVVPRYTINRVPEEKPEPAVTFANMSTCNRILMHYERIILYGDTSNPDFLYTSHLNKFDYYPRTNIVKITDPLRGALQSVKQYKSFLVCFTNGSIQMIQGTNPLDWTKETIHTTLGTKYPYSVQVMRNYIAFVGSDNGVYILKSFNFSSGDKLNVDRIDALNRDTISNALTSSSSILSTIFDNQYYLYIETLDGSVIYRLYYDTGVWVRDTLSMKLGTLDTINNDLIATSKSGGTIYKRDKTKFKDADTTQFTMRVLSKDYDFGIPHHRKKLKQYQLITKIGLTTTVAIDLYADDNLLSTTPVIYDYTQISDTQKLKIITSGRFRSVKTDLTVLVKEPIQLIGFGFVFKENTPK